MIDDASRGADCRANDSRPTANTRHAIDGNISYPDDGIPIQAAFKAAIDYRRVCNEGRQNMHGAARRFSGFIEATFPGLDRFQDLRPYHVQAYQNFLYESGLKDNTVRLYLRTVKAADDFVRRNHPASGQPLPPLVLESEIPKPEANPKMYLSFEQLCACITRAREDFLPSAVLGFTLGGLAGMRLTEIARLTPERIVGDCIYIDGQVKNKASKRVIPICSAALRFVKAHARVYAKGIRAKDQRPFYNTVTSLSHTMRDVLDALHTETGEEEYQLADPHEAARKTFDNLLYRLGVPMDCREGYQGHKLRGMGASHYTDVVPVPREAPKAREEKIAVLRQRVVAPLEEILKDVRF